MAHDIGFVDNTGSEGVAHWQMLLKIKTLAEANGWVTQRYLNPTPYTDDNVVRELILKGSGLSGTEEIYIGFRAYQKQSADYYNLTVAGFTGYVAGNTFTTQPGYFERGVCAHNQRIDYWLAINGQRILLAMKVGVPVSYETCYVGTIFPYAFPTENPYPLAVIGTLISAMPATRYSETSASVHISGIKGCFYNTGTVYNFDTGRFRAINGSWACFRIAPWTRDANAAPAIVRDTGGYYQRIPAEIMTRSVDQFSDMDNVHGALDGVGYVSGFNNAAGNTATIDGKLNVVIADCARNGIGDYFMLEMD